MIISPVYIVRELVTKSFKTLMLFTVKLYYNNMI